MKKDGVLELLRSSRLKLTLPDAEPNANDSHTRPTSMDTDSNTLGTVANSDAAPRVVADVRATSGNRGVPKSGRIWKRVRSQRFSQIRNDKPDSTTWQDKLNKKSNHKAIKSFAQELKEEKLERQKAERERIAENKKRKLENEKKNEIVVPIKNVAKLKRMRKKQLRSIQKR